MNKEKSPAIKAIRIVHLLLAGLALSVLSFISGGCIAGRPALPTLIPAAQIAGLEVSRPADPLEMVTSADTSVPPTYTPAPPTLAPSPTTGARRDMPTPTETPLPIPTNTPVTPSPTPSDTPTASPTPSITPDVRPLEEYELNEVIPVEAFPRPPGDNGWGIHWVPTNKQDRAVVDRFISELIRMHIKWVVFLNDNSNIGDNDYLVDRLVEAGIMPVMRVYRSNLLPYDGDLGPMVAHYRAKGVYYFQLYNEPNTNVENTQGFANPNQYAVAWASAARDVINNGGLPGIGAFSPGGSFNHYTFLERTLQALRYNGDLGLLNRAWLSVHNYHGLRALDDEDGFLLFRKYDEIVNRILGRSMPMIGTEGGSYHPNPQVEKDLLISQYSYMRIAEPYFLAFSHWLLANQEGGAWDPAWEWQALFRNSFVHPLVTEFFYQNRR